MTTITVLTLLAALHTITIIYQQEAFAQTIDNTFKNYENPTYGINIQYPSNWRIDEGDVYADDYVTDIVSFIAPVRSNTEAYAPSLSIVIEDKVYFVTYYAEEEQYSDYLPTIQKMISSVEMTRSGGGLETNTPSATTEDSDKINPPRNQLTDRYYEGLDWREICNSPLASDYISQPCDSLVTSDGNALTPNGKQVMEGLLCPRGRGVISTIELFMSIPDRLESELATACGW